MLNELPDEIITMIINKSCSRPSDYLCLCNINKRFLSIINNYRDLEKRFKSMGPEPFSDKFTLNYLINYFKNKN